jgi:serine/threonine protein kinase
MSVMPSSLPNAPVWKPDLRSPIYVGGQYLLLDQIGEGATSVIFKARDTTTEQIVALKVLKQKAMAHARLSEGFKREIKVGEKLRHPNVVEIYGAGVHEGWTYLVMEYVAGRSLDSYLALTRTLSLPEVESLCRQFFGALSAIHALGIVHRDIKPNNLMLRPDGVWKLMDFGTSKELHAPRTVGPSLGTPDYMSPEQLSDMPETQASDIYSAGMVLYEALTGASPFPGWSLIDRCTKPAPPFRDKRPDVPPWLEQMLLCCLQPQPERRFQNADAILMSLGSFAPVAAYAAPETPVTAPVTFRPLADLLTDGPAEVGTLVNLLVAVLEALTKIDARHDPVTPYSIRFSSTGQIEIGSHGATGRRDTMMVSMPKYAAPELLRNQPVDTVKADLYALGFMAYELFLGRKAFAREFPGMEEVGSGLPWMEWHSDPAKPARPLTTLIGGIPTPLTDLLNRMMDKDAAKRPASYAEALEHLRKLLVRTQSTQQIRSLAGSAAKPTTRTAWPVALVTALTLGAVLFAVYYYVSHLP